MLCVAQQLMAKMCWLKLFLVVFATTLHDVTWANQPNVLFLVVDDLRPQLGCYGETNMVTPNIDQLAAKSVQFNRAYVQQSICSPSRTSFLTGRRPDTTRVFDLQQYFRNVGGNYTTLPQHFKDNGYITQSVGKIFHPGAASGFKDDYPYSWTNPAYHAPTEAIRDHKICPEEGGGLSRSAVCPIDMKTVPGGSLPDIQNADFTIDFLKKRSKDKKPFFIGMGYHKPHLPFAFPKEYLDLYPMSEMQLAPNPYYPPWLPPVAWNPYGELKSYDDIKVLNISEPFGLVPLYYQYDLRQTYMAATTYVDAQVGRVLHALDELGLADNTIVTFHGDHGWQLGDHGEWSKETNFDIALRIPMMFYVPGVTAKKAPAGENFPFKDALEQILKFESTTPDASPHLVSDVLVEAVDLYATLSELAGLEIPATCPPESFHIAFCTEGSSFVPIIKNLTGIAASNKNLSIQKWKRAVFSQYPRHSLIPMSGKNTPIMGYSMRTSQHRYTEWIAFNFFTAIADWNIVYARELYIYASDPDENLNVADVPAFKDLVETLSHQLREGWRKALPDPGAV